MRFMLVVLLTTFTAISNAEPPAAARNPQEARQNYSQAREKLRLSTRIHVQPLSYSLTLDRHSSARLEMSLQALWELGELLTDTPLVRRTAAAPYDSFQGALSQFVRILKFERDPNRYTYGGGNLDLWWYQYYLSNMKTALEQINRVLNSSSDSEIQRLVNRNRELITYIDDIRDVFSPRHEF